jgi:uncharacterized protein YaaN involved in tellurite resistance
MTAAELREAARNALDEIDRIARDYDHYEFGLPSNDEIREQMMDVVVKLFSALNESPT